MERKYNKISKPQFDLLKEIVGKDFIFEEYEIRWTYAFGGSIFNKDWIPDLIIPPQGKNQISEILKAANKNIIPVIPRGNGTSSSSKPLIPYGGMVSDLNWMNRIIEIDIENNVVGVEPGIY